MAGVPGDLSTGSANLISMFIPDSTSVSASNNIPELLIFKVVP
jgi:hypothetical protein